MILVVGASGDLGRRICSRLARSKVELGALGRSPDSAARLEAGGLRTIMGDLADGHGLDSACSRVETVVCSATAIGRRLGGERAASIHEVDDRGVGRLIKAAEQAGVDRFVYVSYAGVDAGLGSPLEKAKLRNERRLMDSALRQVIVRPDAFQELHLCPAGRFDVARGRVEITGKGDTPIGWVAVDDVAEFVATVALEPAPPALIEFGGPEPLSRNQAILIAERALRKSMKRRTMPRPLARAAMRVLSAANPALSSVFGLGLVLDTVEGRWDDAPLRQRGIEPRSPARFIEGGCTSSSTRSITANSRLLVALNSLRRYSEAATDG
jgi:uncharacterized protein YbjT (DUF2867 family)